MSLEAFSELCRRAYLASGEHLEATFVVVNTGLYYAFAEFSQAQDNPERREECKRYSTVCQSSREIVLVQSSLFQAVKLENTEALLLGVD